MNKVQQSAEKIMDFISEEFKGMDNNQQAQLVEVLIQKLAEISEEIGE